MNKVWMIAAAGTVFAGGLFAQMGGEDDDGAAEAAAYYMQTLDFNADGKITKDEIKKSADRDAEGSTAREKLELFGSYLSTFLAADADESNDVTSAEMTSYVKTMFDGKKVKISARALETLNAEYITPWIDQLWKEADANKDGFLTAEEMEKLGEGESAGFDTYDTDGDKKLSKAEIRKVFDDAMKESYDVQPAKGTDPKGDPKGTDPKSDPKATDGPRTSDPAPSTGGSVPELYKKVGRTWMLKSSANYGGMEMISYIKYEVLEVGDTWSKVKTTVLDKDKKEYPGMAPTEQKMEFGTGSGNAADAPKELGTETVKTDAGEFECTIYEQEVSGNKSKSWISKKYPGLTVKTEVSSTMGKSTIELVEFKD